MRAAACCARWRSLVTGINWATGLPCRLIVRCTPHGETARRVDEATSRIPGLKAAADTVASLFRGARFDRPADNPLDFAGRQPGGRRPATGLNGLDALLADYGRADIMARLPEQRPAIHLDPINPLGTTWWVGDQARRIASAAERSRQPGAREFPGVSQERVSYAVPARRPVDTIEALTTRPVEPVAIPPSPRGPAPLITAERRRLHDEAEAQANAWYRGLGNERPVRNPRVDDAAALRGEPFVLKELVVTGTGKLGGTHDPDNPCHGRDPFGLDELAAQRRGPWDFYRAGAGSSQAPTPASEPSEPPAGIFDDIGSMADLMRQQNQLLARVVSALEQPRRPQRGQGFYDAPQANLS